VPPLDPAPLESEKLTWAALLGRWVDFARTAVALPADADGLRMRASVPDLIMLQAVWFSLGQLEELDEDERGLGIDRAALLIEQHASALRARWCGGTLPPPITTLLNDAKERLADAERAHGNHMPSPPNPAP
jgi:hypothetical protein